MFDVRMFVMALHLFRIVYLYRILSNQAFYSLGRHVSGERARARERERVEGERVDEKCALYTIYRSYGHTFSFEF